MEIVLAWNFGFLIVYKISQHFFKNIFTLKCIQLISKTAVD